jgi:uncharacterized protein (TIGR02594 family)
MEHVVKSGESLVKIASAHGTTVSAILAANPQIDDPARIFPGQVFNIPGEGEPRATGAYIVRSGDSMRRIATHFGVTLGALVAANPEIDDPDRIRPGQLLHLPGGARRSNNPTPVVRHKLAPWLAFAKREMDTGVDEIGGSRHNPRILEYHATTTLPAENAGADETAWCSSFVNWCVEQSGFPGTDSAMARSWLDWGSALSEPRKGAVTVFRRDSAGPQFGHVAFYWDRSGSTFLVLGGNQSNQVSIKGYPKADLLGFRWST